MHIPRQTSLSNALYRRFFVVVTVAYAFFSSVSFATPPEVESHPATTTSVDSATTLSYRTYAQMDMAIYTLNRSIGDYPVSFDTEEAQQKAHKRWYLLLNAAKNYQLETGNNPKSLYLLSELYRLGNMMGIKGTAALAAQTIELCAEHFPEAANCHFTGVEFYLSGQVDSGLNAQPHLEFLKSLYAPNKQEEIERGYALLYLYQEKPELALKQIDTYLKNFPDSDEAQYLGYVKTHALSH